MDSSRRMSYLDAALLALETPRSHMQLGMIAKFSAADADVDIRAVLAERIGPIASRFPELRLVTKTQLGGLIPPILVDPGAPVDLDYHIRTEDISDLGQSTQGSTDDVLNAWAAREMAIGLELRRPLWQATILTGLSDGGFAVFFKAHHSTFDGVAALRIALDMLEDRPREARRRRRARLGMMTSLASIGQLILLPARIVSVTASYVLHHERMSGALALRAFKAPQTSLNQKIGNTRYVANTSLSLETVSAVRSGANCTATDVLIAAVSLALGAAMKRRDALPRKPLVAFIPVAQSGTEWAKRSGNRLAVWFVSMETDVDAIDERLRGIAESSRRARIELRLRGADIWDRITGAIPPVMLSKAYAIAERCNFFRFASPLATLVISNVVGPREPVVFAGGTLQSVLPLGPTMSGMLFNVTMVSVGDTLHVGIVADDSVRDIAAEVASDLSAQLERLEVEFLG